MPESTGRASSPAAMAIHIRSRPTTPPMDGSAIDVSRSSSRTTTEQSPRASRAIPFPAANRIAALTRGLLGRCVARKRLHCMAACGASATDYRLEVECAWSPSEAGIRLALPEAGPTRNHVRGFVSPHHWRLDALYLAP